MRELLSQANGHPLDLQAYQDKIAEDYEQLGKDGGEFWKLERRQLFQEPEMPSWRAYIRGDWDEAIRLAEQLRPDLEREYREDAARGIHTRWIKIVELPMTPYVHWAFHPLRVRAQSGERMRVVRADQVTEFESHSPLPEMVTLGTQVMYEILYTDDGDHNGGVRIDDSAVVAQCRQLISNLYDLGEDMESFYQREVAHLEPPRK